MKKKIPFVHKGKVIRIPAEKKYIVYNGRKQYVWVGVDKRGKTHKRAANPKKRGRKSGRKWSG